MSGKTKTFYLFSLLVQLDLGDLNLKEYVIGWGCKVLRLVVFFSLDNVKILPSEGTRAMSMLHLH